MATTVRVTAVLAGASRVLPGPERHLRGDRPQYSTDVASIGSAGLAVVARSVVRRLVCLAVSGLAAWPRITAGMNTTEPTTISPTMTLTVHGGNWAMKAITNTTTDKAKQR